MAPASGCGFSTLSPADNLKDDFPRGFRELKLFPNR